MGCYKLTYNHLQIVRTGEDQSLGRGKNGVGLIVSGFNHAMHQMTQEDPLKRHANEVKHTLKEWEAKHQDMSYDEIKNEVNSHKGQEWRYIKAPDGNIMDMRHVIVVGYGLGDFGGDLVEVGQLLTGNWDSAFDIQDFYSNKIGDVFHQLRDLGSWSSKSWSYDFKRFIDTQYSALFNNYKPVKL